MVRTYSNTYYEVRRQCNNGGLDGRYDTVEDALVRRESGIKAEEAYIKKYNLDSKVGKYIIVKINWINIVEDLEDGTSRFISSTCTTTALDL